jgi:hypothetical protein
MDHFLKRALVLAPILCAAVIAAEGAARQSAAVAAANPPPVDEMRFPVAHAHFGGVCRGYLSVGPSSVRYAVVQPDKDKNHSFQILRSEITALHPWILGGQAQNIAEIRTSHATYHFWLLRNDAEVNAGGLFNGNAAAPAATLIAAIRDPASAQSQAAGQSSTGTSSTLAAPTQVTPAASGTTLSPGSSRTATKQETSRPPGALEGIYVALGADNFNAKFRRLNFNPDGWVVKDIPQEGMIGFDFTAYRNDRNTNRNWVGRYRVEANEISIDWQDFRGPAYPPSHEVVRRDEISAHPAWDAGWDTFIPMCRCTGKTFSGKYNWGAAAAGQYLQFFPDGTFIDHSVTDQLIVPSRFYEHPRVQRGTYSIESQTMVFSFADGHRGMRTFMAPKAQENDPMFDWIGLGWQQLYEENYEKRFRH